MPSTSALPTPNSLLLNSQPICIGDGLDVSAIGLISTLVLPSAVGLIIWVCYPCAFDIMRRSNALIQLIFSFVRPRFRQVYGAREWFPPQEYVMSLTFLFASTFNMLLKFSTSSFGDLFLGVSIPSCTSCSRDTL